MASDSSDSTPFNAVSENVTHKRYVVARQPNAGIGDHLSCAIGAWWYAKRTGRVLVVDWRGSRLCANGSSEHNCFTDFFGHHDRIGGVSVVCDQTVSRIDYQGPFFPVKWNALNILETSHIKHSLGEVEYINELAASSEDRPEPTVIFNQWIAPGPPKDAVSSMLRELQFSGPIRAAADKFWQKYLRSGKGLAIHIRHGNGENIGARAAYWLDPWRFFQQLRLNSSSDIHRPGVHGRFFDNMPKSLIRSIDIIGSERRFLTYVKRVVSRVQRIAPGLTPMLFCDSKAIADEFVR